MVIIINKVANASEPRTIKVVCPPHRFVVVRASLAHLFSKVGRLFGVCWPTSISLIGATPVALLQRIRPSLP